METCQELKALQNKTVGRIRAFNANALGQNINNL